MVIFICKTRKRKVMYLVLMRFSIHGQFFFFFTGIGQKLLVGFPGSWNELALTPYTHKGWDSECLPGTFWLGFPLLALDCPANDGHVEKPEGLWVVSPPLKAPSASVCLSAVFQFSIFIFCISPLPFPSPPTSFLSVSRSSPRCCKVTENIQILPNMFLWVISLSHSGFASAPVSLERLEAPGQGWPSPPLHDAFPFRLEATAVLPLVRSQGGRQDLNPTLLKAPGPLFSLVLLLRASLSSEHYSI